MPFELTRSCNTRKAVFFRASYVGCYSSDNNNRWIDGEGLRCLRSMLGKENTGHTLHE